MRVHVFCRVSAMVAMAALVVVGLSRVEAATVIAWGETGHSFVDPAGGQWYNNGTGVNAFEHYAFPPDAGATSTWDFAGIANGTYYVSVDWTAFSNRTTSARYSISDGGGDVVLDQQDSSRDFYEFIAGVPIGWKNLGVVTVADGALSVTVSDDDVNAGGFMMADAIRIDTVAGVNMIPSIHQGIVVDNGDAGHTYLGESGSDPIWAITGGGFDEDNAYDGEDSYSMHTGVLQSEWVITGLTPGAPTDFSATWPGYSNRGTNVPFTISGIEGGDQTVLVDQQPDPVADYYSPDSTGKAYPFQSMGVFTPTGTSVTITMSNDANGFVIADAVRAQVVPEPTSAVLLVLGVVFVSLRRRKNG